MDANADTGNAALEPSPPRSMETHPRNSIQKIAVLFTDVVGSTRYFQNLGDVAGRQMLKQHQDIASAPIVEHGGFVVKTLGDSVMAYFMDPKEAVKSAIKIQQRFMHHNRQQKPDQKILVRIGIHWGEGIVEDQDIFGNVVNLAAKIVPLAGQDQIFVSHDVCKAVANLAPVHYEKVSLPGGINDLEELNIYQIIWDETIHFDPTANILLFLRPLWKIAGPGFKDTWNRMIRSENRPWPETALKTHPQDQSCLILVSDEISSALETAKIILTTLQARDGKNPPEAFAPVQLLVDSGPYLRADKIVLETQDVKWNEINPGNIYLSSSAFRLVKDKDRLRTDPPFDYDHPHPIYRLITDGDSADRPLFMYRSALLNGRYPTCFYCGSKKHRAANCPSKKLGHLTRALEKMGYLSFDAINGNFMDLLTDSFSASADVASGSQGEDESFQLARQGYYELKSILQLRFFRNLWDALSDSWNEIKTDSGSSQKGGQIWLALDMIRTSRPGKAESLLNTLMLEQSQDYRVLCTQGLLFLEQNNLSKAEYNFERALMFTKTKPQRILILFLLSRLFEIRGNLTRAGEKIDEILHLDPSCVDARYQRMVYRFYRGQHKIALAELTKLIHEKRELFVKALIDPDLAAFSNLIEGRLKKLFNETKEKAEQLLPKAEVEKNRLKSLLGPDGDIDSEIKGLWEKKNNLLLSGSYFGFLDLINIANLVTYRCLSDITGWKNKIDKTLSGLRARLEAGMIFVRQYPYPFITTGLEKQLQIIGEELRNIEDIVAEEEVSRFKGAYKQAAGLSARMQKIPVWLKRLDFIRNSVCFLSSFFRVSLTLQTINLVVGIILLPVVSHYVVIVFPELKAFNQHLWFYQKGYLIFGAVLGLVAAIIKPLKKFPNKS